MNIETQNLFHSVHACALEAGAVILDLYHDENLKIIQKQDGSPVTKADTMSHAIIKQHLKTISSFPIISEEDEFPVDQTIQPSSYWLIDPLDGTKDFLAHDDEFSINIALVQNDIPMFGYLHFPALGTTYWAMRGGGSYRDETRLMHPNPSRPLIGTTSRFYTNEDEQQFFQAHAVHDVLPAGAALKFCRLAEGAIDVYPRFHGSHSWDTAAGQLIAEEAGCIVLDYSTKKPLSYPLPYAPNPHFIATRKDLITSFV